MSQNLEGDNDIVLEGADITAEHMVAPAEEPSEIVDFYRDSRIFLTGATGFVGKLFLEKLLRTCSTLHTVYVLIRPKKGKTTAERFQELFDGPNFDPLRRKFPNFSAKVVLMAGDCSQPELGLCPADRKTLIDGVDCIFHCAATVRFNEKLRIAAHINVRSTRDLLRMAKQMKRLRAMIHVSTAFSNCVQRRIDETFYEPPMKPEQLLSLVDILNDDQLEAAASIILGDYPNTYVFTKAIAENVVCEQSDHLPIAVFRPSVIIASVKEPVAGWIDNWYGATGVLVGAGLGVLRSLHGCLDNASEMVPADYVVNCGLAAAWQIASIKSINTNMEDDTIHRNTHEERLVNEIPVYNFVSTPQSCINWAEFTRLAEKHAKQVPTELQVWHYFFAVRSSHVAHLLAIFFYHKVPAYLCDWCCLLIGKPAIMVKGYQKIDKFGKVLEYFAMRQWQFTNANVVNLWKRMNRADHQLFTFNMANFNWDMYFYTYVRGARAYLLKDPLETIPAGNVKYVKLMVAHYALMGIVLLLLVQLTYCCLLLITGLF